MKYTQQHEMAVAITESRNIGMMVCDTKKLKEVLIPCPLKCLQVSFALFFKKIYFCDLQV